MSTKKRLVLSGVEGSVLSGVEGSVLSGVEGCDNCGEELGPNPVQRGDKTYCCEACAFEAQRSVDCGGRSDSTTAPSVVKQPEE
jgi:hypothetical protein